MKPAAATKQRPKSWRKGRAAVIARLAHDRRGFVCCRVCRCTVDRACASGCGWAQDDLCTTCDYAAAVITSAIDEWRDNAYKSNMTSLMREVLKRGEGWARS